MLPFKCQTDKQCGKVEKTYAVINEKVVQPKMAKQLMHATINNNYIDIATKNAQKMLWCNVIAI